MTDKVSSADNQQERSHVFFYYTGFCCGEMSCSLLRLSNRKSNKGGVYYTPDITISNSDKPLLREINQAVAGGNGVITAIKGGYNLSIRGKRKVKRALAFFRKYPPVVGDLSHSKLTLISQAIDRLEAREGYRRSRSEQKQLEEIRKAFIQVKKTAVPISNFSQQIFVQDVIGYFLCGVLDAEGSVGIKKSGSYHQSFFAVAMKDRKIVELFKDFLKLGNIHFRPKEKIYHFEIGARKEVLVALRVFLETYPSKLMKVRRKMRDLRLFLNDYTPGLQLDNLRI